jgi:spore coat protein H
MKQRKFLIPILLITVLLLAISAFSNLLSGDYAEEDSSTGSSSASAETASVSETQNAEGETVKKEADSDSTDIFDNDAAYDYEDSNQVTVMYLTVSQGNATEGTNHTWSDINKYSVYDYEKMGVDRYKCEGLLQVGTENGPTEGSLGYGVKVPNAIVQIRGQTSSESEQKNYKISLKDNAGEWNGQTTIDLNKKQTDGLRYRTKLCFDLMKQIDQMLSLKTSFVHLWVKDRTVSGNDAFVDYGLFIQIEQLNKTALKQHGLDKNGQLYKVNFFEFRRYEDVIMLKDDEGYSKNAFEQYLEIKGSDDHSKLIKMLDDLNNYSVSIDTILDKYFNLNNLSYWLAFQLLVDNTDTQSRNYYLYSPLNSEVFYFYSWDQDLAFMSEEYALNGRSEGESWENGISNYWGNILFQRAVKSEKFMKALDDAVNDLRTNYLTADNLNKLTSGYSEIIKPYLYENPDIQYAPVTSEQYDQLEADIPALVSQYYQNYVESLQKPMPFYVSLPVRQGDKFSYSWETSYSLEGRSLTYHASVCRDLAGTDIISSYDGEIPEMQTDALPAGQYFLKVYVQDSEGNQQDCFDYYTTDDGKVYGTYCFYVNDDGSIAAAVTESK